MQQRPGRGLLALVLLQVARCSAEDELNVSQWFHDHFPVPEATSTLNDFADHMEMLKFALSDQQGLPTPAGGAPATARVVSTAPFVIVFEDFLSDAECEFLKRYSQRKLEPAMVVLNSDDWYGKQGQTRSNEQTWFQQNQERQIPILRHIMKRMHRIARVPDEYAEALQVGRYNVSNKYEGHLDTDPPNGVGRPMTLITYLHDVESGGDTLFPIGRSDCNAGWHTDPTTGEKKYGCELCCNSPEKDTEKTIRVQAKKGRAVLFFNHFPDGTVDQTAKHIGCPVNQGEKWIAQRWFRFEPYNKVSYAKKEHKDSTLIGWDVQFDGLPAEEAGQHGAAPADGERHLRTLSHSNPKAYMEHNFLTREETSEVLAFGASHEEWTELHFEPQDDEEQMPWLAALTERAHLAARMRPNQPSTVRLRKFAEGVAHLPEGALQGEPRQHKQATGKVAFSNLEVYVRIPERGGGLAILSSKDAQRSQACALADGSPKECCARDDVLKVPARAGDAVLEYNFAQDYSFDRSSARLVCPAEEGETWMLEWTFWTDPPKFPKKKGEQSTQQPNMVFSNMEAEPLKIYWVPPTGGEESFMQDLGEHPSTSSLDTHNGHAFHVRDQAGTLVQKVYANNKPHQQVQIRRTQQPVEL